MKCPRLPRGEPSGNDPSCAFTGKDFGRSLADAARAAGNQRYLVLQTFTHALFRSLYTVASIGPAGERSNPALCNRIDAAAMPGKRVFQFLRVSLMNVQPYYYIFQVRGQRKGIFREGVRKKHHHV